MPTGYTASVADGTVTELKPFALQLARGMGALVMMRDEPWDAPIPDQFEPSSWNSDKIEELKLERVRLFNMTTADIKAEILKECNEYDEARAEHHRKFLETRERYEAMLAKVEAWTGAPEGIKDFALSQLRDAMQFDCPTPYRYWASPPETDPQAWFEQKAVANKRLIEYHTKEHEAEIERTKARNDWIKQLKESLNDQ